jgi:hypothetical protein
MPDRGEGAGDNRRWIGVNMGDKGSKKNKDKSRKQQTTKQQEKDTAKQTKSHPKKP